MLYPIYYVVRKVAPRTASYDCEKLLTTPDEAEAVAEMNCLESEVDGHEYGILYKKNQDAFATWFPNGKEFRGRWK